jgi:hypothetical protein
MRFTVLQLSSKRKGKQLKEIMDTSSRSEEGDKRRFVNASRKSLGR